MSLCNLVALTSLDVYIILILQFRMVHHYLALALLLISTATPTFSFSSGAPRSACETLAPNATQHGADPQTTEIPYVLNLSAFFDPALGRMAYTPSTVYDSTFLHDYQYLHAHTICRSSIKVLYRIKKKKKFIGMTQA